jgi:hypothetical protein
MGATRVAAAILALAAGAAVHGQVAATSTLTGVVTGDTRGTASVRAGVMVKIDAFAVNLPVVNGVVTWPYADELAGLGAESSVPALLTWLTSFVR